jgi:hypothetical protein
LLLNQKKPNIKKGIIRAALLPSKRLINVDKRNGIITKKEFKNVLGL